MSHSMSAPGWPLAEHNCSHILQYAAGPGLRIRDTKSRAHVQYSYPHEPRRSLYFLALFRLSD